MSKTAVFSLEHPKRPLEQFHVLDIWPISGRDTTFTTRYLADIISTTIPCTRYLAEVPFSCPRYLADILLSISDIYQTSDRHNFYIPQMSGRSSAMVICERCLRTFTSKGNLGNHRRACRTPMRADRETRGLMASSIVQPEEGDLGQWQQEHLNTQREREV